MRYSPSSITITHISDPSITTTQSLNHRCSKIYNFHHTSHNLLSKTKNSYSKYVDMVARLKKMQKHYMRTSAEDTLMKLREIKDMKDTLL
jgi:vacuolar-type H+-ATPase catalytic subunit A/Vma1